MREERGERRMTRKILAGLLGLAVGIVTIPIVAALWPFAAAWFMFNEEEE